MLMALVVALALAPAPPVSAASADGFLQRLSGFGQTELVFAVAGDPQGREEVWSQVVKALNSVSPAPKFTLLLGDLVASGTEPQYKAFADSAKALKMPFYAVPGNHDIRGDGAALFRRYVSDKLYYSFEEGGYKFIGLNTGDGQVDAEQMQWLQKELAGEGRKIVFMHIPLEDPRPGGDHALLGRAQADELHAMFASSNVVAVFSGHVHMFAQHEADGVLYVTSGGAGAALYASPEEGGMFHFALVRVRDDEITVEPQPVQTQVTDPSVEVSGPSGTIKYSLGQLMQMSSVEGASAFENRFGNFTGHGVYLGVPVADLVAAVGGIQPGDVLRCSPATATSRTTPTIMSIPPPSGPSCRASWCLPWRRMGLPCPRGATARESCSSRPTACTTTPTARPRPLQGRGGTCINPQGPDGPGTSAGSKLCHQETREV